MSRKFMRIFKGLSFRTLATAPSPAAGGMYFDGSNLKICKDGISFTTVGTPPLTPTVIMTVTIPSAAGVGRIYTLPNMVTGNNFGIDWGDGTPVTTATIHSYTSGGSKTISIGGWEFSSRGTTNWGSLFENNTQITSFSCSSAAHVTAATRMFGGCSELTTVTLNSMGNVSSGEGTGGFWRTFYNCSKLTSVTMPTALSSSVSTYMMFSGCGNLTSISLNLSGVIDSHEMFIGCAKLTSASVSNTGNVIYAASMFSGCSALESISLNLNKATGFYGATNGAIALFNNCSKLANVNVTLPSAKSYSQTFYGCAALTTIPSGVSFTYCTDLTQMFQGCTSLTTVAVSAPVGTTFTSMFNGCTKLTSASVSTPVGVTFTTMFSTCSGLTSVSLPTVGSGTTFTNTFLTCPSLSSVSFGNPSTIKASFSLPCALPNTALNDLLDAMTTGPSVSATATLSSNPGWATIDQAKRTAASGRGWSIV